MSGHLLTGQRSRTHIWLFDHAGSDHFPKTELEGERYKEAKFIDKSLSALSDVIASLTFKTPMYMFVHLRFCFVQSLKLIVCMQQFISAYLIDYP